MAERVLHVELAERRYPIVITDGGMDDLGIAMAGVLPPGPCVIVTNPVVGALYGLAAADSLQEAGFQPNMVHVPDGESFKTIETWAALIEDLLVLGMDRHTPLVALGGGVLTDIAAFAAATVLRGVPLVQVPTTLLAMVDASVGGKTGVNTRQGKNLVGAFHQPRLVYAGTQVLTTLDNAEWRCGLGESLKHGIIRDAVFFDWMLANASQLGRRDPDTTAHLVEKCCAIKASVVSEDEREIGPRAILNFGHTVGHALETALGHGVIRHGEAVALGMLAEARYARARGWCEQDDIVDRITHAVMALGLPTSAPNPQNELSDAILERLVRVAGFDKKMAYGSLTLVIPVRIGQVRLEKVPAAILPDLLSFALPGAP